ncbi:hypothetical protein PG996_005360 [Apiospora saccharicola]|uniref:Uncharacterized protein n=1 Tax=Apiospora saccharicola TaxID=335842 RepID=A0ABR1VLI8_9PEZI
MAFILGLVGRALREADTSDERDTFSPHDSRTRQYGHHNTHQAYPSQYQQQYHRQPYPPCQQPQPEQYAPSPPILPFGRGQPGGHGVGPMPMTKRERRGCRRAERQCRRSQRHGCSGPSSSYPPYQPEEAWAAPQRPFASRREESGRGLAHNVNNINNREAGPSRRPHISDEAHHSGRRRRYSNGATSAGEEEELPPPYEEVMAGTRSKPVGAAPVYEMKG